MKSISPYHLWKFVVADGDHPFSCTDGDRKYVDYRLSMMLSSHGMKLKSVTITNDIETFENIDDLHYLKAHIELYDEQGCDAVMDIKPRYYGDDGEWALLMGDKTVNDIDIRFCLETNRLEPTWIAVIEGDDKIPLDVDCIEWDMLYVADAEPEGPAVFYDTDGEEYTPDELYDMTAETFDPDYDINDSPYNNWR